MHHSPDSPMPRRSVLVPALALAILTGLLAGGVLVALDLAPRRHQVVYHTPATPKASPRMSLDQAIPVGPSGIGDPLLDCVASFLRSHGGDDITRNEGITSDAFRQLSLQAQFACINQTDPSVTGATGTVPRG